MNSLESNHFLASLDVEQLADTLEEIEPEFQASLIEGMTDEKVADVLEEMEPDEAADLLAELSPERSHDLLALMEKDEADDVRRLLTYPRRFRWRYYDHRIRHYPAGSDRAEALQYLRENWPEAETVFYVYMMDCGEPPGGRGFTARAGLF